MSISPESLAAAEEDVALGRAANVSAWVDEAMQEKARRSDLAALLADMRAENGPATNEEDEWARRVLGL